MQDAGEAGIGGVTVTLTDANGNAVGTTTTNASGGYLFASVPPGAYTVTETDPSGFTSTTANNVAVSVPAGGSATATFGDYQIGTVGGVVFNDLNGNGLQDAGEAGLSGVTVSLLDAAGAVITTTTNSSGGYFFGGVTPGAYTVVETDPAGYASTTPNSVAISVSPNGSATANFGDQQHGTVSGMVYNDLNGNGVQDAGESGIGSVSVNLLDSAGNVMTTTTTTGNGSYLFTNLPPGDYAAVQERDPAGYTSTTPNVVPIRLPPGGSATANFGDQQIGTVGGVVFNDLNGDGGQDASEAGIGGVIVTLTDANGTVVGTQSTAGNGSYLFTGIVAGSYTVIEQDPANFVSTTPNRVPVNVPAGGSAVANFGDQQIGTVGGVVFNDLNGDGVQNAGEAGIGGVSVTLLNSAGTVVSTTTAGDGNYLFANLTPGTYTVVETDPAGFVSTTANSVAVNVAAGGAATANFGDQQQGSVSGVVYTDLNGNGVQDAGEAGIGGVSVSLLDSGGAVVTTTMTTADGGYLFTSVQPGAYTVVETDPAGYTSTTPNVVPIRLSAGGSATASFGDQPVGTVSGVVFNDRNGDGVQTAGEAGIGGVVITLFNSAGTPVTTTTGLNGSYLFTGIVAGAYTVVETDPSGFVSTTANRVAVSVPPGGSATASFGDQQRGTVSGVVFNDRNGNGVQDAGEAGIGGVTVTLTDANGNAVWRRQPPTPAVAISSPACHPVRIPSRRPTRRAMPAPRPTAFR